MQPIAPIGDRTGVAPVHAPAVAPVTAEPPPGVAVAVSPLGQLLGTLAQAQKRLGELAGAGVAEPSADIAQLGIAAGELVETYNLARTLPLPGQDALRERLAAALDARSDTLAQAGIVATAERLDIDSGRLLAAFGADRQRALATLAEAAAGFAEALPAARPDPAPVARPEPAVPEPVTRQPAPAAEPEPARADNPAAEAARRADEAARSAARAAQAAELAQQQAARLAAQRQLERQAVPPEPSAAPQTARADAQRLAELQVSASLETASQAALTQEARQAAYRLEVAREVANAQLAVQDDVATQDQRLMEARAAALRQLDSTQDQDLAAQGLAKRMARERSATNPAQTPADRLAQERLDAARRAAARADVPLAAQAVAEPDRLAAQPAAALVTLDEVLRAADNGTVPREAPPREVPLPPNAADPAVAAAIAAQRLAGGVPGGAAGPNPAPPPRTELVPPVRPVTRVAAATPMQGGRAGPRGTR